MNPVQQILAALEAWKRGMIEKDIPALDAVLHPDLAYTHSNAKHETKAEVLEKAAEPEGAQSIEFSNVAATVYGDAGLVKADVDYTNRRNGEDSLALLNVLHVFVKDGEAWRMVARQAVRRS